MDRGIAIHARDRIVALSRKVEHLKDKHEYQNDNLSEIFFEKMQYNLSLLLAEIICNLQFVDRSKEKFVSIINEYNVDNHTSLVLDDFLSLCWIRIIHKEVFLPRMIESFMWNLNGNSEKIKDLTGDKRNFALCLLKYYNYYYNNRIKISFEKINNIIGNLNIDANVIKWLIEKHLLELSEDETCFYWGTQEHYPKKLNDEIAAILWIIEKNQLSPQEAFFRYYNLIRRVHIILNSLSGYLTHEDHRLLFDQVVNYLKNEDDLQNSDKEIAKIWYDSESFSRQEINMEIPKQSFLNLNVYELLETVNNNRGFWHIENLIFTQKTRGFCFSLIRFIFIHELKNNLCLEKPYTLEIINDTSRPILVFEASFIIKNSLPEIIPYLLADFELSPIAMDWLDEFNPDPSIYANDIELYNKEEKIILTKNELWAEAFDIILSLFIEIWQNEKSKLELIGKDIALIFLKLSKKIFNIYLTANQHQMAQLQYLFKRYSESLNSLQNIKTDSRASFNIFTKQSLFLFVFQHSAKYIIESIKQKSIIEDKSLRFDYEYYDISLDFIRTVNNIYITEKIDSAIRLQNDIMEKTLVEALLKQLCQYFTFDMTDDSNLVERFWFGFYIEKLSYIDWGYFFVLLYKYDFLIELESFFPGSINIDISGNKYTAQNHNQIEKVRLILWIILSAYLSLKKKREDVLTSGVKVNDVCRFLEVFITRIACIYYIDKFEERKFDAFDDFPASTLDRKNETLFELLLNSLNFMSLDIQKNVVEKLFHNSVKLDRMLTAINILSEKELKDTISSYINNISIEDFVESCFMITDIEEAVFQALYTESHWEIASILIKRIKKHYSERKIKHDNVLYLLYQADLLLALRKKSILAINAVVFPKEVYYSREYKIEETKRFYIALHKIENEKQYPQAISILENLSSANPQNTGYGIILFKAEILNALNPLNLDSINAAYIRWRKFIDNLQVEKVACIEKNRETIGFYSLPYYIFNNRVTDFDMTMPCLTNDYLYHELILNPVYDFYLKRNLVRQANDYINNAKAYYNEIKGETPSFINEILSSPNNLYDLKKYFQSIITTDYKNVPKIVPDAINNKNELNSFILKEIVQALRQMIVKIQTIKKLNFEDNHTDILQAILNLRFPFYGWTVKDHSHSGTSERGKGPGEPDIIIESYSQPITIAEAFILMGKNRTETHRHIKKCFNYANFLERYYLIIYFKGESDNFTKTWEEYKKDFNSCEFPIDKKPLKSEDVFVMLDKDFDNTTGFLIAKTCHDNFEMFHIMVNFSIGDVCA